MKLIVKSYIYINYYGTLCCPANIGTNLTQKLFLFQLFCQKKIIHECNFCNFTQQWKCFTKDIFILYILQHIANDKIEVVHIMARTISMEELLRFILLTAIQNSYR